MRKFLIPVFILLLASAGWTSSGTYDYPFTNPYVATIIGTPSEFAAPLPEKIKSKNLRLTIFKDREVPSIFWPWDKLDYSLAYQKQPAPLIFIIAGTGASYNSGKMQLLAKAFFGAGFHVIAMSSPTHPDFIVNASQTGVPGNIQDDSRDLYHVMELAWQQVKDRIQVSQFYLTGYSLGAAQAAFISQLDEQKRLFNFSKVLMINPPLSLYNSAQILDEMLEQNIPGGLHQFHRFYNSVMLKFAEYYKLMGYIDFTEDYLYEIYKREPPPKDANLAALIGTAFRLSSSNMVFTSDVMTHAGLIVPPNQVLTTASSLTDYFIVTANTSFVDYFNELFYPYFEAQQPGLSPQALIDRVSLASIESYLRNTPKIALMTNEDDLILAPGEIDFFRRVLGARAKIYPIGGHCGNMAYKDNIEYMIGFFKN
ncbi:MAG: alpha/beta hydrolase [Desulfobacterales bacterium]|nr:MAG: alpha/beta hydrolase [Desulfobacterales bacterium]